MEVALKIPQQAVPFTLAAVQTDRIEEKIEDQRIN